MDESTKEEIEALKAVIKAVADLADPEKLREELQKKNPDSSAEHLKKLVEEAQEQAHQVIENAKKSDDPNVKAMVEGIPERDAGKKVIPFKPRTKGPRF